jgi:hypothetical protein
MFVMVILHRNPEHWMAGSAVEFSFYGYFHIVHSSGEELNRKIDTALVVEERTINGM